MSSNRGGSSRVDLVPVFDLDGTLLDSDAALVDAFVALGVPQEEVTFGHTLEAECQRLGIGLEAYLDRYDAGVAQPFPMVDELVAHLDRWAVCSNKHPRSGRAELARLGWAPEVSLFADAFGGGPKRLGPVLEALGLTGADVVFVGDTAHDRRCAADVQCPFVLAAWNERTEPAPQDLIATRPLDVLHHLRPAGH